MISVIVPVYKVEKYLDKCVQSIIQQTYQNFELILVDDGSPDNCPKMCDEYARKYNDKIKVLHKKNGGLSDARNAGTMIAKGEYVTYIDSDDYVAENYLEKLYNIMKDNNADIAVTGIEIFYENKKIKNKYKLENKTYIYSGEQALEKMLYQNTLDTSACAMLIPVSIAKEFLFPIGKYHEDEYTTYKYYANIEKVAVTTERLYFYLQRSGSIMHVFGQSSMDELDAADNLVNYCLENYPLLLKAAESKKFSDYCQVFLSNKNIKKDYTEIYKQISEYLKQKRKQILLDSKCRIKNRFAALILFGGLNLLLISNKVVSIIWRNGNI